MKKYASGLLLLMSVFMSLPAIAEDLTLAVSEGSSGGLDAGQVIAKYKDLADILGRGAKAKVNVIYVRNFETLQEGFKAKRYAFAFTRPSSYSAIAMRDNGYSYVASVKPDGQCYIIAKKDSPLKELNDIKGKKIVMPEKESYMTSFCTAELRTKGIDISKETVTHTKEQAAVAFYLENNLAEVGAIASYSNAGKNWEKTGGRILHKSIPQPYSPLVASSEIKPEQIRAIRTELLALSNNAAGKEVLKRLGIEDFETNGEARMRELPKWLGQ